MTHEKSGRDARGPGEHAPPYPAALVDKLDSALRGLQLLGWIMPELGTPEGLIRHLHGYGIALVDPTRQRCWIDETVYAGALFRLRAREAEPSLSLTLPQDLFI